MNAEFVSIDFETRSACPLKTHGVDVYAEHASTDVLCLAWAFGDGPVHVWKRGEDEAALAPLFSWVASGKPVRAWNAAFELALWHMMHKRQPTRWPALRIKQCFDPMAQARVLGFPGALGECALALGVTEQKDTRGSYLINRLSKPQKDWTFCEDAALHSEMADYCKQDVRAERAISQLLPALPPTERALWVLDRHINQRGVGIDLASVAKAMEVVDTEARSLSLRAATLTAGAVQALSEVQKLVAFLEAEGVSVEKLNKDAIRKLLARDDLTAVARELVTLRRLAAKTSTAKLKAMQRRACADATARGLLAYMGADTGRWAGRGIQTQNMPGAPDDDFDGTHVIEWLSAPNARAALGLWYGSPLDAVSFALRSLIQARAGKRFIVCDYANIEGRCLAWEAEEEWKLDAFREYDAGTGPDLYKLAYHKSFGVAIDAISKAQRQIGKVQELALGYQGGVGAFASMAANYGIHVVPTRADAPKDAKQVILESEADEIKNAWRDAHPNVVAFWYSLERAAMAAIREPGRAFKVGPVQYKVVKGAPGSFLLCRLPSGRHLAYPRPRIVKRDRWGTQRDVIECWGKDKKYRKPDGKFGRTKWGAWEPYGGLFAENITQAIARDLLAAAMLRLEARGYTVVMHVHDEIVCEVPHGFGSVQEMEAIMCELPAWATGLPVTAEGWEGVRYKK